MNQQYKNSNFVYNMFNLLKLNLKLIFKSLYFYFIIILLTLVSAVLSFLKYRYGPIFFSVDFWIISPEFIFSIFLSIAIFMTTSLQYRDGFYRNKIITGNSKSSIYFADLIFNIIIGLLLTSILIVIQPIMYSSVKYIGGFGFPIDERLAKQGLIIQFFNVTLPLNIVNDCFMTIIMCSFITMVVNCLTINIKWMQTIIYSSIVTFLIINWMLSLLSMAEIISNNVYILYFLPFGGYSITNVYQLYYASEFGNNFQLNSLGFIEYSSGLVQLGYSILFSGLGLFVFFSKNFK